ncbi:hypothetical protein ACG97_09030 [Vogesella sp. EB]|uniref:hypothetical protein n=1 Tax=unclassified Vogesella TaxID=2684990 RepID=UPI00064D51F7|nr:MULTISPECIES: hypothetical protein [unclassified Vogesella]KMJ53262.1 hypothetical protein ACG97_09030 [Vogesella sp. EB]MCQ4144580.1 hypothetical protein [Vogesella sp. AC12]
MGDKINELVASWCSGTASAYSCDLRSSSVRNVSGPVPAALVRELEALAHLRQRDPACMVGDLLAAAISDALAALPDNVRAQLKEDRIATARAEAEEQREVLSWHVGGT